MFLLQNHIIRTILRYKGQIDGYYVFITEPYHVLWYKGQIDVYYVFITEPYHVL